MGKIISRNPQFMSHTRVKTTYSNQGIYGSTETIELYCHHNHSCDCTVFYWKNGEVVKACFNDWESGNDLWDAMQRLWFPFKEEWGKELKGGVEYYSKAPWEQDIDKK